ncbi:22751_t:CDS:1 [Gigaspora margarita]|uniref:22751_t:CDS:1 n=1 Tax=Gigaspora margarita TaxID=4874 RepID=A0ABN7UCA3_GIGMA|nr:22751_t:CDS:1 [Gigaspora margarita]
MQATNATNAIRSTQTLTQKVKINNDLKPHIPIKESISKQFQNRSVHAVSVDYDNSPNSVKTVLKYTECPHNGFAEAIIHAYNHHQHLRLSPDDIWLTIVQGISRHININAEKFRSRFVKHEGQKEICIDIENIIGKTKLNVLEGNWPEVVNRLVIKTDEMIEKIDLTQLLACDYSTTTPNSLTASRIVLLDTVKAYFSYSCMMLGCGIPKVTLEGTLEDWTKLQEKVMQLRNLNLEMDFWLDRLEPVVWKLVSTYCGDIDENYWSRIMNINVQYGSGGDAHSSITGWFLGFFPYGRSGSALHNNYMNFKDIPLSIVEVPFKIDTGDRLKFAAGFIGAHQEISDGESIVSPVIGWSIVDDDSNDLK